MAGLFTSYQLGEQCSGDREKQNSTENDCEFLQVDLYLFAGHRSARVKILRTLESVVARLF